MRKDKIEALWPLMAGNPGQEKDIRKYEEIGTHPAANYLAIADALTFHQGIGQANKAERLRYLFNSWAKPLRKYDNVHMNTSFNPKFACGLANIQIKGVDSGKIGTHMWNKHRIIITPIKHAEFEGLRITPHVYTTMEEIERFVTAMEDVIKNGLPA